MEQLLFACLLIYFVSVCVESPGDFLLEESSIRYLLVVTLRVFLRFSALQFLPIKEKMCIYDTAGKKLLLNKIRLFDIYQIDSTLLLHVE